MRPKTTSTSITRELRVYDAREKSYANQYARESILRNSITLNEIFVVKNIHVIRNNDTANFKNLNCIWVYKEINLAKNHAMQTRPRSFKNERQFLALQLTLKILAFLRCIFQRFHNELTGFSFCVFAFPFIRFRKMPDLLQCTNVKFRSMFSRLYKSGFWIEINIETRCDIESLSNQLKITKSRCVWLRAIFHEEYARGYANVRCSVDLWFMHRQNEYAEISENRKWKWSHDATVILRMRLLRVENTSIKMNKSHFPNGRHKEEHEICKLSVL